MRKLKDDFVVWEDDDATASHGRRDAASRGVEDDCVEALALHELVDKENLLPEPGVLPPARTARRALSMTGPAASSGGMAGPRLRNLDVQDRLPFSDITQQFAPAAAKPPAAQKKAKSASVIKSLELAERLATFGLKDKSSSSSSSGRHDGSSSSGGPQPASKVGHLAYRFSLSDAVRCIR